MRRQFVMRGSMWQAWSLWIASIAVVGAAVAPVGMAGEGVVPPEVASSANVVPSAGASNAGGGERKEGDTLTFEVAVALAGAASGVTVSGLEREHLFGDVFYYSAVLVVGDTPNAKLRLHRVVRERAPWVARPGDSAVMLLHGDFSTFVTNFMPAQVSEAVDPAHTLAGYLARAGIDVWGVDRRWTTAPAEGADVSDFGGMTFAAEIDDIRKALELARSVRGLTDASGGRLVLAGFSRGAQLAYEYAGEESQRPPPQRHVKGLVPIDFYARLAPEDEAFRLNFCTWAEGEYALVADGVVDVDNSFFIALGSLAVSAPDEPSPIFEGYTNRQAMLLLATQTYYFYPATPAYHLIGGSFDDADMPTGTTFSPEAAVADWFIAAAPHQSMVESADGDALLCNEAPLPLEDHLADIRVPIFYLGAAGGVGDHGIYTTTVTGSRDVTTRVVKRLEPGLEAEDFGHADLLFAEEAPSLAWEPLARWILAH